MEQSGKKVAGIGEDDLEKVARALEDRNHGILLAKKFVGCLGTSKEIERKYEKIIVWQNSFKCCRAVLGDLQLRNVSFSDLMSALEEIGNYDALLHLSPQKKPEVVQQPQGMRGQPGTSLTLTVVATGNSRPSFCWYKYRSGETKKVEQGRYAKCTVEKRRLESHGKLIIPDLHIDDEARYCCVVSNEINHCTSDYCNVIVESNQCAPRILKTGHLKRFCYAGNSISLECEALGKPNELAYVWYRNGARLNSTEGSHLTVKVHGKYHCEVTNEAGSDRSPVIEVFLVSEEVKDADDGAVADYFEKHKDLVIEAPEVLLSLGPGVINSYFTAVLGSGSIRSRRVTVMVVGQDLSGKTALARALIEGLPKIKPDERDVPDSTCGIEITAAMCDVNSEGPYRFERISGAELVPLVEGQMKNEEKEIKYLFLKFCDFAGQPIYFNSNSSFMLNSGIYLIVHDLVKSLDDVAVVKVGIKNKKIYDINETCGTNGDYIKTWISGVAMTTEVGKGTEDTGNPALSPENAGKRVGPVAIAIGTHFDKIMDKHPGLGERLDFLQRKKKQINALVSGPPFDRHFSVSDHFYVDSIGYYHYASTELDKLRRRIVEAAKSDKLYEFDLPCSWLSFEAKVIREAEVSTTGLTSYDRVVEIAKKCGLADPTAVHSMLEFYHAIGSFLWFSAVPQLKDTVVTKPQRLLDLFRCIISLEGDCLDEDDGHMPYWRELRRSGVISYEFVVQMLSKAVDSFRRDGCGAEAENEELKVHLFHLLQKFDLIAPYVSSEDELAPTFQNFIIPSMINWDPPLRAFVDIKEAELPAVFLLSDHRLVPDALFNRLIVRMVRMHPRSPEVYRYFARFHVDEEHDLLLFNWKGDETGPRDRIKIAVQRLDGKVEKTSRKVCGKALFDVANALVEVRGHGMQGIRFQLETAKSQILDCNVKPALCNSHKRYFCAEPSCLAWFLKELKKNHCQLLYLFQNWPVDDKSSTIVPKLSIVSGSTANGVSFLQAKIGVINDEGNFQDIKNRQHSVRVIRVDSGVRLHCQTSEIQEGKMIWYRQGSRLPDDWAKDMQTKFLATKHSGLYSCVVESQSKPPVHSKSVYIQGVGPHGELVVRKPEIVVTIGSAKQWVASLGETISMEVKFETPEGRPSSQLQFQWRQNDIVIPNANKARLEIKEAADHHAGTYRCCISQSLTGCEKLEEDEHEELMVKSHPVEIEIAVPSNLAREHSKIQAAAGDFVGKPREGISKIALVIGNRRYKKKTGLSDLSLAENDACSVADALESLGFTVFAYADLTYCEMADAMQRFYKKITPGSYALFFFAGHGFEWNGDAHMMPVDGRQNNFNTAFRDKAVEYYMKLKSPRLTVIILDSCRVSPSVRKAAKAQLPGIPSGTGYKQFSCYSLTSAFEKGGINSVYCERLVNKLEELARDILQATTVMDMLGAISKEVTEKKVSLTDKKMKRLGVWQCPQTICHGPEECLSLADGAKTKLAKSSEDGQICVKKVCVNGRKVEVKLFHAVWLANATIIGACWTGDDIEVTFEAPSDENKDKNIIYDCISKCDIQKEQSEPAAKQKKKQVKFVSKRFKKLCCDLQDCDLQDYSSFVKIYIHQLYEASEVPVKLKIKHKQEKEKEDQEGGGGKEEVIEHLLPKYYFSKASWF
eukprot:m.120027 g.120027  ORF g.120027 m.120027 type:complete len:1650 (+) comp37719_c0_seq7:505-5454(+)